MVIRTDSALRRAARNIGQNGELGDAIIAFLHGQEIRLRLIKAAEEGLAPASVVSELLVDKFGAEQLRSHTVHRFIGLAIRMQLEAAGFETVSSGIRTPRDPLFTTATIYKKRSVGDLPGTDSLIARFIASLTDDEIDRVKHYINNRRRS